MAGRVGVLNLLPIDWLEFSNSDYFNDNYESWIFRGAYPAIYSKSIPPNIFYANYFDTYLQRDVRNLIKVGDIQTFNKFMRIVAGRAAQLINYSELARDADIAPNTAKNWLSILESSYIIFRLEPYHNNHTKRLIKSSKIYFYDTGLLCYLLRIGSEEQLQTHFIYGNIVENMIVSEINKLQMHNGERPQNYFWRESNKAEIDIIIENENGTKYIEIKSSKTYNTRLFDSLK